MHLLKILELTLQIRTRPWVDVDVHADSRGVNWCEQTTELILRQFFDVASLAQNDMVLAAVSPPKKAQDDGFLKEVF
jgi:hypothetical protein